MRPAIRELVSIIKVGLYGSGMGGWGTTIEGPWNFPLILLIASRRFWPNSINFTAVHRDTLPRFSHVKKIRLVCGPFVFCVIWHMTFFSTRWNHLKQMILESSYWNFSYCSTGSPYSHSWICGCKFPGNTCITTGMKHLYLQLGFYPP